MVQQIVVRLTWKQLCLEQIQHKTFVTQCSADLLVSDTMRLKCVWLSLVALLVSWALVL